MSALRRFLARAASTSFALLGFSLAAQAETEQDAHVARGAYLATLGDCAACHTGHTGARYAGGLAIRSPFGTIYSTNITPDRAHGIGTYTLAEFSRAVRQGIRQDGTRLYPAMPYPSFARLTDQDVADLYAYFEHGVAPSAAANRAADMRWPYSMRWTLRFWQMAFAPSARQASSSVDPTARGAYLVESLGHCGACHTPRGFALQERALTASDGAAFLAGGTAVDGWVAPSLRNGHGNGLAEWSEDEIVDFLRTGRTNNAAVFGSMVDVVAWSTRFWTEDDLKAAAHYLKTLPGVSVVRTATGTPRTAGAALYQTECAACHGADGAGIARIFPPLAGNAVVQDNDPLSLIHIVLDGAALPATHTAQSEVAMPAYRMKLSDQQIADVLNTIQTSWGNHGPGTLTAADISRIRSMTGKRLGVGRAPDWSTLPPQPFGLGWNFSPESHETIPDKP